MRNVISHLENFQYRIEKMSLNFKFGNWNIKKGKGAINYLASDTILVGQLGGGDDPWENVTEGVKKTSMK